MTLIFPARQCWYLTSLRSAICAAWRDVILTWTAPTVWCSPVSDQSLPVVLVAQLIVAPTMNSDHVATMTYSYLPSYILTTMLVSPFLITSRLRRKTLPYIGVVSAFEQHFIRFSAHDFSPFLMCFADLGTAPFHIYRIIGFDKLQALDVGVTHLSCDNVLTVLHLRSNHPLSRVISIDNSRYSTLPPSVCYVLIVHFVWIVVKTRQVFLQRHVSSLFRFSGFDSCVF